MWEGYIGQFSWGIPYWSFMRSGAPLLLWWRNDVIIRIPLRRHQTADW
jgi:hypothetical protein